MWLTNMYGDDWKKRADLTIRTDAIKQVEEEIAAAQTVTEDQRQGLLDVAHKIILGEGPKPGEPIH